MKTDYKYIHFVEEFIGKRKTRTWSCRNLQSGACLGEVHFNPRWTQFCFFPQASTLYSIGCLENIIDFIRQAQMDWRENRKK